MNVNWTSLGAMMRRLSLASAIGLLVLAVAVLSESAYQFVTGGGYPWGRTDYVGIACLGLSGLFGLDYLLLRKNFKILIAANCVLFGLIVTYLVFQFLRGALLLF